MASAESDRVKTSQNWSPVKDASDACPELKEHMNGYTALHFTACQNNGKLVSHLLSCSGILVNNPDTNYKMTPLHCSLKGGSIVAFQAFMNWEESAKLDVNAEVSRGCKKCARQEWVAGNRILDWLDQLYSDSVEDFLQGEFRAYETPLHFGIRFCRAEYFLEMIATFLKHPNQQRDQRTQPSASGVDLMLTTISAFVHCNWHGCGQPAPCCSPPRRTTRN
ncbi:hypothetical protein Mapa_003027 [Marchantia paleacea]|nr:hypothetical protein Mapa_003027 [Marchantia paleacea]